MLQKEVAERLAAAPGSKVYGILSVLLQAWYDVEYLFTVNENVFNPPPKVKSGSFPTRRSSDLRDIVARHCATPYADFCRPDVCCPTCRCGDSDPSN